MRQVALIPVFCALLVSTTGFLPGIERDDGISMRATPSRKAIPVRPPSLPEAVRRGRSGILSLLLQAGVDSDAGEKGGPGSLMLSLHGGLRHLPAREKREESAVHVAVLEGRVDVLSHLLAAGGSPADKHPSGWNPLQLALQRGDLGVMKILLAHGADPRVKGAGERTSLDLALALESSPAELELLVEGGADPNQRGPDGRTAVQVLLAARDFERTGALLRHGGKAGSALYNAVVEGDREIFSFLVGQGVRSEPGSKDPVLVAAVREGQAELVEHLLQSGAMQAAGLARRGREGQSALHLAVVMNRLDLCRLLLEAGADPNASFSRPATGDFLARVRPVGYLKTHLKYDSRVTPLMAAADCGNLELARLLMEHGAKRFIWTSRKSYYPIGFASRRNDVKMMQLLLGVDPGNEERWLKVDLSEQKAWVYGEDNKELFSTRVSTGRKGYRTKTGEFVITNKNRHHVSNIYKNVRMPYFQRLSCGAVGFHEGYCPDYPASHGCLRVPRGNAAELWKITEPGDRVVIVP